MPKTKVFTIVENQKNSFPILSNIARDYLAMQASSLPLERGFSTSGLTVLNFFLMI